MIAFRNEAFNLPALLHSISSLNYPAQLFEVILVDDQSDDNSAEIISNWKSAQPFAVTLISSTGIGKKAAQYAGVTIAAHQLIACTDADCLLPIKWLETISESFDDSEKKLVFGPILLTGSGQKLQKIEFLSLIGSTMAMLQNSWAVMGNAANMAFRKDAYLDVFPNLELRQSASGDDVFLLHELSNNKNAVGILYGINAIVKTNPHQNFRLFLAQRMRWASKAKLYTNVPAIAVASLVFFVNLFLLMLAVGTCFSANAAIGFTVLFFVKIAADFVLLTSFGKHFRQDVSPSVFLVQEVLNLFYIPLVAVLSQLFSYTWKGRKH